MSLIRELMYSVGILKQSLSVNPEKSADDPLAVKEFDYMLAEMNEERELINERQRRIDQVVAFYIAILTALIAAAVAGVTKASGTMQIVALLGDCLLAAAVGHVAFIALLLKLAEVIASHSHFYVRRQYFFDKFPGIRRYIEHRTHQQIREVWRVYLSREIVLFLRLFASFNSVLLAVFIGETGYWSVKALQRSGWVQRFDPMPFASAAGILVLTVTLIYELRLIARRVRRAKEYSLSIFEGLESTSDTASPNGTFSSRGR